MTRTDWLIIIQGIAVAAQIVNAGIATAVHDEVVSLTIAAIAGAVQYIAQHIGNQTVPR